MTYDPQARRPRPAPDPEETAPVDALIGNAEPSATPMTNDQEPQQGTDDGETVTDGSALDPGSPRVAPRPADPVPDSIIAGTGVAVLLGAVLGLLGLRWFWKRTRSIHKVASHHQA